METFDIEEYTFIINNSGELKVVTRANEDEAFMVDLNNENAKITKESGQEFGVIGDGDTGPTPVSNTGLNNNDTSLNTGFEIIHIGGSASEVIDLNNSTGYINLENGVLYFSKET